MKTVSPPPRNEKNILTHHRLFLILGSPKGEFLSSKSIGIRARFALLTSSFGRHKKMACLSTEFDKFGDVFCKLDLNELPQRNPPSPPF